MQNNDELDDVKLQELLNRAQTLPREIPPAPQAWSSIRDRIESGRVRELAPRAEPLAPPETVESRSATKLHWLRNPRFALPAAAALFIATTLLTVLNEQPDDSSATNNAAATRATTATGLPVASPSIELVFAQYDAATADLSKDLDQRRARLQPEAVAVLDSCLTTIDRAIKESRSALAVAPDNATIAELLQLTYQQKLDLLRRASDLPLNSF